MIAVRMSGTVDVVGIRAARMRLASFSGWFTDGHDTPDLKEAKELRDELAA